MAIVEMKHISLLALKADREKLMKAVQKAGCVQFTEASEEEGVPQTPPAAEGSFRVQEDLQRLTWAIARLRKYDTAGSGLFATAPEATQEEADRALEKRGELMRVVSGLEELEMQLGEMRTEEAQIEAASALAESWSALDAAKADLRSSPAVEVYTGTVQTRRLEEMKEKLAGLAASLEEVGQSRDLTCVTVFAHKTAKAETEASLQAAGFAPESFTAFRDEETPAAALERLRRETESIAERRAAVEEKTKQASESLPELKLLYDQLMILSSRLETEKKAIETEKAFYAEGWVPAAAAEQLKAKLEKISPSCSIELRDPQEEEEPPVALQNSWLATPFEGVIEGFAMPAYRAYDPTAIMAPFYACLFGMMVSDAGYGLVMALIIPLFIKWKKIKFENAKMMWLLTWGGVMTVIWGLIYNTVFGFNPLPKTILDSVGNSLPVMVVCIVVGALHLFTGLGIAAYLNFRKGDWLAALADQISWVLLIIGLVMLILPGFAMVGKILAITGAALILLFTRRDTWNPIKRIMSGLGALYGISSWVSDLLSYMRLFGMGLATGVIGMVFNQLIGIVWNGGIIGKVLGAVLFVGCHGINLAINVLGAYVHSCRLQYIEFFGKFYEEGGKPFRPLNTKTKYISITEKAA